MNHEFLKSKESLKQGYKLMLEMDNTKIMVRKNKLSSSMNTSKLITYVHNGSKIK